MLRVLDWIPMQKAIADLLDRRVNVVTGFDGDSARKISERAALGENLAGLQLGDINSRKLRKRVQVIQRRALTGCNRSPENESDQSLSA